MTSVAQQINITIMELLFFFVLPLNLNPKLTDCLT